MTDAQLTKIRDGFDQRVQQAFEAYRGKPLVRAKKNPPLGPNRGNYVRGYSFSIVEFATRCFILNEQQEEANAALQENAQHYLDNPKDINDRDSFHWHSEMVLRLVEFYGAKGTKAAGRMTPATEKIIMDYVWEYCRQFSTLEAAETEVSGTWRIHESENHHVQRFTTCWHFAKLAKDSPDFRSRKYDDGHTAAEHYAAWSKYIQVYCAQRARKGLFVEVASSGYNAVALKGLYNVADFAESPALRKRVSDFLDLYWAIWAQEQLDGVRGGGASRIYQSGGDRAGGNDETRHLAWFYFGIGEGPGRLSSPLLSAMTSSYRPPLAVIDLALDPAGRGRYAIHQRPMGLAEAGFNRPPDYKLRQDFGGIHRYSWCTPDFILGTQMFEARPSNEWTAISAQNRWHGVIFSGDLAARIVPQVQADDERVAMNAQWAVQDHGSLVCQKLRTAEKCGPMRVWFSKPGLGQPTEENGWVFVEAPHAYAAVRVVAGGYDWQAPAEKPPGTWLCCRDEWTPVILEVACKDGFPDLAAFRKAVAACPMSVKDSVLSYRGLGGATLTLPIDQKGAPTIDGKPVDYAPPMAFDSPFVKSAWNSGVVEISKGARKLTLDFRD